MPRAGEEQARYAGGSGTGRKPEQLSQAQWMYQVGSGQVRRRSRRW